jgi:hypothetical protein
MPLRRRPPLEQQGMEAWHTGDLGVGPVWWHSDGCKRAFLSMFMDSVARFFRAGKLTVFPRFKGGTGNPVSPVGPRRCMAGSYPALLTHYKRRGTRKVNPVRDAGFDLIPSSRGKITIYKWAAKGRSTDRTLPASPDSTCW